MERFRPVSRAGATERPNDHGALPEDVLEDAPRRLVTIAAAISVSWIFSFSWSGLIRARVPSSSAPFDFELRLALLLIALIASASVAARVLGRELTVAKLRVAGFAYFATISLCLALAGHITLWGRPHDGWSGTAIVTLLFPIVVPVTPRRAGYVGLLFAAINVAAFAALRIFAGHPAVGLAHGVTLFRDDLAAALLAVAIAHLIQGLGFKVVSAQRMGSYVLERKLGHGGMGEVWRGQHARLARPAAIKLIRPQILARMSRANQEMLQTRFELEVQATAALRSPNTVAIYDFGVGQDGTLYYVMELLDGMDLHEAIRAHGPMPPERVIFLLLQACHSLQEAHERGLVHRDLKPSNLFLCRYGADFDFMKVLDFGLVKLLEDPERQDEALGLTAAGAITGTPAFMAPEQAARRTVDARSDIYLVGCIAYFLLTGRLVFPGPSPAEMMSQHLRVTPEPVAKRSPFRLPGALAPLVMQCLEKQPDARPQTIASLAKRLREIPLETPWTQARAESWWTEHDAGEAALDAARA